MTEEQATALWEAFVAQYCKDERIEPVKGTQELNLLGNNKRYLKAFLKVAARQL